MRYLKIKQIQNGKMHLKIQDSIGILLKNMSEIEKSKFSMDGRTSSKYKELYNIYKDSKNDKILLKKLTEFKAGKTAEAFNDLNSELYKKLLLFLSENDKQNDDENKKLTSIIDIVNVLIKRKLFNQASVELMRAYRILKNLEVNEFNYHLYLQYLNLVLILQTPPYKSGSSKKLRKDFEEIETIDWLNRLSLSAAQNITKPKDIDGVDFNKNIFFNLLGNYYLEHEKYRDFTEWVGDNITIDMPTFFNKYQSSKKLDDTIKSIKILSILEAIYSGYKLNDKSIVDEYANILKAEVFYTKDSNYQIFSFLLLHLHDIQLKMSIKSNIPIDDYYYETQMRDLKLFTENELDNVSVRIEINKGIVHFYNRDFKKAEEIFKRIDTTKIKSPELRYYIRFYELLTSLSYGYDNFDIDSLLSKIQYLKDVKNKKSGYSKGLLKLIENHHVTFEICKHINDLQEKNKAETLYDSVLENWTMNLV